MYTKIFAIALAAILLIGGCGTIGSYNTAVNKEETLKQAWAQVENVYQRRADLIPNLVNTVKGAANFEKSTLEAVIQARASATQVKIDPSNLTEDKIRQFEEAQQGVSGALSRLLMVTENYPELKANANFRDLQIQLEGTENRIAAERKTFNETVQNYNQYIRQFPTNLLVGIFGFSAKGYFQSSSGSDIAPTITF